MVEILCNNLMSERCGLWDLYLYTDNFCSGVSPDLCIGQTLMAGLKGATGLTSGRSLTEQNRLIWMLSRPAVVLIDTKMRKK